MKRNLVSLIDEYKNNIIEKTSTENDNIEENENDNFVNDKKIDNTVCETQNVNIGLISFGDWVKKYKDVFQSISRVKLLTFKVDEMDGDNNLLFKAPSKTIKNLYEPFIVKRAMKVNVPDIRPIDIYFFDHDVFKITYDITEFVQDKSITTLMKVYCAKRNNIITFCVNVKKSDTENILTIPYSTIVIKNNIEYIALIFPNIKKITDGILSEIDSEAIQLFYTPYIKERNNILENINLIEWLLNIQKDVIDLGHQLKIDNVIQLTLRLKDSTIDI